MHDTMIQSFRQHRRVESCNIRIGVGPTRFNVTAGGEARMLTVEIYRAGRLVKTITFWSSASYNDFIDGVDPCECGVRVLDNAGIVLATLDVELDLYPFMRPQGDQKHVTENYVAVPPALTITDDEGAIWTLGMKIAPRERSPDGEFAFPVLRNGVDIREIASRIERRAGKVKIFTCEGWKVWTGKSFF